MKISALFQQVGRRGVQPRSWRFCDA